MFDQNLVWIFWILLMVFMGCYTGYLWWFHHRKPTTSRKIPKYIIHSYQLYQPLCNRSAIPDDPKTFTGQSATTKYASINPTICLRNIEYFPDMDKLYFMSMSTLSALTMLLIFTEEPSLHQEPFQGLIIYLTQALSPAS